ncbi:hypothetical protein PAECIP111893_00282 [Paenibacillus plantiphilus]|uniref:Uncharacterized protein n=1 Tax=Paenibacillus plantiphilus TaxID=2905650 RepID=A0ABN8FQL5_9BACL|nr:hypothetical protein PAECIP111893_00282 [Paenibacillus plantiphilus]
MVWYQDELCPVATKEEIKQTKSLLSRYRRQLAILAELDQIGDLAPKQQKVYNAYRMATAEIERAARLIVDEEIRRAIEYRYIKGHRHKLTVLHFSHMDPSTVDRRINKGIESVANSLKLLGQ